ncbi:MAG TPA: hypothetical protein VE990_08445 [Acidimicrobiales bacterium]|nr:hypothetical protein [Acidimicrobiales bacterium]
MTQSETKRPPTSAASRPDAGPARPPTGGGEELVLVESCTTTWAFDTGRRRFARLPRGLSIASHSAEWRPYVGMTVDRHAGTLEVVLDQAGTELLRSEVHTGPCPVCGAG